MNIDNLILGDNSVTVSYLIHYDSLLQNATDIITKCNGCCIAKCDRSLLQNASGFLIQNATVLLQNVTVTTNCDNFITKCELLQNAAFITNCDGTTCFGNLNPLLFSTVHFLLSDSCCIRAVD